MAIGGSRAVPRAARNLCLRCRRAGVIEELHTIAGLANPARVDNPLRRSALRRIVSCADLLKVEVVCSPSQRWAEVWSRGVQRAGRESGVASAGVAARVVAETANASPGASWCFAECAHLLTTPLARQTIAIRCHCGTRRRPLTPYVWGRRPPARPSEEPRWPGARKRRRACEGFSAGSLPPSGTVCDRLLDSANRIAHQSPSSTCR